MTTGKARRRDVAPLRVHRLEVRTERMDTSIPGDWLRELHARAEVDADEALLDALESGRMMTLAFDCVVTTVEKSERLSPAAPDTVMIQMRGVGAPRLASEGWEPGAPGETP